MEIFWIDHMSTKRDCEAEQLAAQRRSARPAPANARLRCQQIWEQMLIRFQYRQKVRARIKEYADRQAHL